MGHGCFGQVLAAQHAGHFHLALLARRADNGAWSPVTGIIDPGEHPGDAALRELVARRIPLYRFVMKNIVGRYDLDRVEGRLGAVREAAPLVGVPERTLYRWALRPGVLSPVADGSKRLYDLGDIRRLVAETRLRAG